MLASLSFNYEGARRPERDRLPLPFFGARYSGYYPYQAPVPFFQGITNATPEEPRSPETVTEMEIEIETIAKDIEDISEPVKPTGEEKNEKQEPIGDISGLVINSLSTAEAGLSNIRDKVDTAKVFIDDIIYKFESILQIIEVVRSNEERRAAGAQITMAAQKTNKDSIDEILELLQTPAMQSIIRQVLVGVITKNSAQSTTAKME